MTTSPTNKTYSMSTLFGIFLWGRHMAVALRDRILKDNARAVKIDFTKVEFATRAFADEFLKMKHFLEVKGITLQLQGTCPEVEAMLKHVSRAHTPVEQR